jgi:hypothetical protein
MPWWEYDATPFWLAYLHHPTTLERLCTFPFVGKRCLPASLFEVQNEKHAHLHPSPPPFTLATTPLLNTKQM